LITVIMSIALMPWTKQRANAITDVSQLYPVDSTYAFIKSLEGYSSQCFWDIKQWTIGYGNKCPYIHTTNGSRGDKGGHTISEKYARELFSSKLSGYVNTLKSNCSGLSMTQNQFDALLSATYNHGNVNSCPLKYYLEGSLTKSEARENYYIWCINAGTADEKGLRNRRKKEADLFFKDEPTPKPVHYDPKGYLDSAEGGYGTVTVTGWAIDRDTPNEAVEIHIYMDGPSGQGGTCVATGIIANQPRSDVNNAIGVPGDHGFSATFNVDVAGTHTFYAYGINRGGGSENPQLNDCHQTYIYEKTNSIISSVSISDMTPSGYTVTIGVSDESFIGRVAVPVWTTGNATTDSEAQDDLISGWQTNCLAKKTGTNTYVYYVSTADHNNEGGQYCNDVYAYNLSGEIIDRWCIENNHRTYANIPSDSIINNVSVSGMTPSGHKG
ncbi:MAG: GBS Bsp-like repeat-containing protein, partial [Ruminococcus sp.]|nr:GBS Bsp-like repeat-containing protein [Ruminococcus sp.]